MKRLFLTLPCILNTLFIANVASATPIVEYAKKNPLKVYTVKAEQDGAGIPLDRMDQTNNFIKGYKVLPLSRKGISDLKGISTLTVDDNGKKVKITDVPNLMLLFANNEITEVPAEIGRMKNVFLVHFKNNQISTVPNEIGEMTALQRVYFTKNKIKEIPAAVFKLDLQKLEFADNFLKSLPDALCKKTKIVHLNMSGNALTALPNCIGELQKLRVADFSDNDLLSIPESLANVRIEHTLRLSNNKRLKTLPDGKGFSAMKANITIDGTGIDPKKLSKALQARTSAKDKR